MTHQLKPNVYWIEGGGGNSGVIVGDKGVIVIDAKTTAAGGKELLDDIAKITPKPVTTVILTHSDGDHVNGLASFPAGITVIAHENNKKEQETALAAGGRGAPPAGSSAHAGDHQEQRDSENRRREIRTAPLGARAHQRRSGGLSAEREDRVHRRHHRDAAARSADPSREERLVGRLDHHRRRELPRSTPISSCPATAMCRRKADIQKRLTNTEDKRAKIKELVAQGKSLDEIKTAVGDAPPAPGGPRAARRSPASPKSSIRN